MIEIHPYELATAAAIFLLTLFCLNKFLLGPCLRVMQERQRLTTGRLEEADELLHRYQRLTQEYEASIRSEKSASYRRQEERRNVALERRAEMAAETRGKAEAMIAQARQEMASQLEQVKARLASEAQEIAVGIGRRVLGRDIE